MNKNNVSRIDTLERYEIEAALHAELKKLSDMAAGLSLAEEQERVSIAAGLQNQIGQKLLLARIKLGMLEFKSGDYDEILKEARTLLDQTIQDVRMLTIQLCPPLLAEAGLGKALEWLSRQMMNDYDLRVEFEDDGSEKPLSDVLRLVVFQAARELLINVAKHAQSGTARLTIGREENMLHLTVEDQGIGFDPTDSGSSELKKGCFGYFNIRQRIQHLGGTIRITSSPGIGTSVTIRAPLNQDQPCRDNQ